MTNQEKIERMVDLQVKLNNRTNGENWLSGVAANGKTINWALCSAKEVSEMIDCLGWKHWKDVKQPFDVENFKVELVDVIHFVISGVLEVCYNGLKDLPLPVNEDGTPMLNEDGTEKKAPTHEEMLAFGKERAAALLNYDRRAELLPDDVIEEKIKGDETFDYEEELFNITQSMLFEPLNLQAGIDRILLLIAIIEIKYNFGFDDVYKLYVSKNILNIFRQDNGYAEGNYVKIWDGEEDNVYIAKLIEEGVLDPDEIYKRLDAKYKTIKPDVDDGQEETRL